jgi:GPH family glycoside/pentoside/hexuronide:cation symporter
MLISFILVFTPPNVNAQEQPWIIFVWLTLTLCLFDTCETLFTMNYFSLFPDKFRSNKERRNVSAMSIYIGFIGVVFSALLPPMIVEFGNLGTYFLMALICISVNFICLFIMLPGVRDDKETVETFILKYEEKEREPLFRTLKTASKHKSLVAFLLIYMTYLTLTNMVQGSFYFWIRFIRGGEESDVLYVMLMFLFGSMAGIPLWYYYNKKTGDNRKTMLYSGLFLILFTIFFSVITSFTAFLILTFIWATALGGFWTFYYVVFSDVIDESIAETGLRREGFYHGLRRFFGNLARVIQAFYFAIVLELTGFREGATMQTALAKTGILLLIGIIPAITMSVGFIIFWRVYDITPERSEAIKEKLKQLKI